MEQVTGVGPVDDWALIERRAAAFEFEASAEASAPMPGEPAPIDPAEEVADVLKLVRDLIGPLLPYIPEIYTDDVCAAVADKTVPVLDKYGIAIGGVGGLLGPELALAALVLPLGYVTVKTHKAYKEALANEARAARQAAIGTQTVQPAAPVVQMPAVVRDGGGMLRGQGE
ncbi:hypothetical protein [Paraburkholderia hospita]|uniref:hypothetical protein n=1 Tax=Paraburkholderia hospita TaxID=169430 RepID=UPI0009A8D7BE|nr:hypothetical protein [Paraburkholderia hospita]SKC92234.1 hypothetical protein SAMN05446934_6028 [Paraburkholderia hospita]